MLFRSVTTRTFDGAGNCLSMTYPGGRVVQYSYDVLDQVASVSSGAGGLPSTSLARYQYDGPGRMARILRANGSNTRIRWDGLQNPPNAPDDHGWLQVAGVSHTGFAGAVVIDQRRFTYDQKQNKTTREQVTEFVVGQGTLTNRWSYDPLNQLTRAINTKGNGSIARAYHLDAEGNRLEVTNGPVVEFYTRDATFPIPADFQVNQYTTTPFGNEFHDNNGNRVQVAGAGGQLLYTYDYADRLVFVFDLSSGFAAPVVSFTYDALGERISKTTYPPAPSLPVTTYFVYCGDPGADDGDGCAGSSAAITVSPLRRNNRPVFTAIETRTGGPSGGVDHGYCYAGKFGLIPGAHRDDSLATPVTVARFSAAGLLEYYFHCDDLGSTLALTDAGGNVLERCEYDEFGAPQFLTSDGTPTSATASVHGNPFLFHGMEWDGETGLYYDRSLYQDPKTGGSLSRGITRSVPRNLQGIRLRSAQNAGREKMKGTTGNPHGDAHLATQFNCEIGGVLRGGIHQVEGLTSQHDRVKFEFAVTPYKDGEANEMRSRPGCRR